MALREVHVHEQGLALCLRPMRYNERSVVIMPKHPAVLGYLEVQVPMMKDKKTGQLNLMEDLLVSVAWLGDNEGKGTGDAAKKVIDKLIQLQPVLQFAVDSIDARYSFPAGSVNAALMTRLRRLLIHVERV